MQRIPLLCAVGLFAFSSIVAPGAIQAVEGQGRSGLPNGLGKDSAVAIISSGGAEVFEYNGGTGKVPASTMKIVTAATSLHSLGANRVFPTIVQEGKVRNEIFLVGGGDPMLSLEVLKRLATETSTSLRGRADRKIKVYADMTLFPSPIDAPGWLDEDSPTYAAPVGPLAMYGSYSQEPGREAGETFVDLLNAEGVRSQFSGVRKVPMRDGRVLAATVGERVERAVELMLKVSENNIAEVLFRQVALAQEFRPTWKGGRLAAIQALEQLGVDASGQLLLDGSGLSPRNKLSPSFLVALLSKTLPGNTSSLSPLRRMMPIAGIDGTLVNRFVARASCARESIWAKTGSLTGVNTLAGVALTRKGEWRVFAIMVNGWDGSVSSWSETSNAIDEVAARAQGCLPLTPILDPKDPT